MSKSALRQQIAKKLIENYNRKSEKTVGQAARILLESADVRQCLVIKNRETRAIQTGYEAAIGRPLSKEEGTKYRAALKKYFRGQHKSFPKDKSPQTRYFMQIIKKQGLTFGKNVFYIPTAFETIKDNINKFNEKYAETVTQSSYKRENYGDKVNLDHGADGSASGLVGSVVGSFEVAAEEGGLPKSFRKIFSNNLVAVLDRSLNDLTKGQKGKMHGIVMKLVIDAEQIISKSGDLRAGLSVLLTPVLKEINIQRGSTEERQIQEAFLKAFEMTFRNVEYENLEGSSTLFEKIETTIVHDQLANSVKSAKNVKVKTGAKKVRTKSRTKVTEKGKRGKGHSAKTISRGGALAARPKARSTSNKQSDTQRSMFSMMAMINQKLPQTVRKNMRSPGLENRTGRFASSVRLTEVLTTPRGFPSFGYTYQKNPYQVYEPGKGRSPWANSDRDPRGVIDASIREIAAELALGRFFTRRV